MQSVGHQRQSAAHLGRALAFRVLRARLDDEPCHHEDLLEPVLFHRMCEAGDVKRRSGGRPDCGCGGRACNRSDLVPNWQALLGFVICGGRACNRSDLVPIWQALLGFVNEDSDGEIIREQGGVDGG